MHRVLLLAGFFATASFTRLPAQIGELRLNGGLAQGLESGGLGSRVVTTASFSFVASSFAFGPEALYVPGDKGILGLGFVARVRLANQGLQPYLIASLSGNSWKQDQFVAVRTFSGSVGAGVGLGSGPQPLFSIEARLHDNLQNVGVNGKWAFATLTGGIRLGWW